MAVVAGAEVGWVEVAASVGVEAAAGSARAAAAILGAAAPRVGGSNMFQRLKQLLKHRWMDRGDTLRAIPDDMALRLAQRVAASEGRHTGEIRLCVEAALPMAYVWRSGAASPLGEQVRQRALSWFGRLAVWDTEHNNGVLIYLLLAERAIEVVADRALTQRVDHAVWQAMVQRLGSRLHEGAFEDGLTEALEEVSALLVAHFPLESGALRPNELNNAVVRA